MNGSDSKVVSLIIPVIALSFFGGFLWAVRGSGGFGGPRGGLYAGFGYALIWYFLSKEADFKKKKRYSSPLSILTIAAGIGLASMRGWMQWAHWVQGIFYTDFGANEYLSINPVYGYAWWFITGISWGGLGSVALAWTGSKIPPTKKDWIVRILFGFGGMTTAYILFQIFPQLFLPFYDVLDGYDPIVCYQCHDPYKDNLASLLFLGLWFGFLLYEVYKRDWRNVKLILTVSLITGTLWTVFQVWHFFDDWILTIDSTISWDWWKGWEILSGMSIGAAYGVGFYLWNQPLQGKGPELRKQPYSACPVYERLFGFYMTIYAGIILVIRQGGAGFMKKFFEKDARLLFQDIVTFTGLAIGLFLAYIWQRKLKEQGINPGNGKDKIKMFQSHFIFSLTTIIIFGLLVTMPSFWEGGDLTTSISLWIIYLVQITVTIILLIVYNKKYRSRTP